MIGQHLILRCAKGCYDSTAAAGLKTAAVSDNVSAFPNPRQQELNKVISEHAAFPDLSAKTGSGENRGVLRLFEYRGVLMAMRTFRVHDLCDTTGSVSFTHTYMIADDENSEDRKYVLAHPISLATLKCFDDYKKVSERTEGGLNSGNPITVNTAVKMPDKDLARFDTKIFKKCGFDRETFALMVSAICHHVSTKGWIGLVTPNITPETWNETGGSADGEMLLAGFYSLLPDCITRFLNAVSYWDQNPSDDFVKDYHLRILSGKYTDGLIDKDISYINLKEKKTNTEVSAGNFGRFLWDIKNKPDEVEKFHNYITAAFGKRVDKIAKMPIIMDALTDLYKFTEGDPIDEQVALAAFLQSIGTSIPLFPAIYKGVSMLVVSVKDSEEAFSDKLENVITTLLKNPDTRKMKTCYDKFITLVMRSVTLGTAKDKTIQMIVEQIGDRDVDEYRDQFIALVDEIKKDEKAKPSYSMICLLMDVQDIPLLKDKHEDIKAIITRSYNNAFEQKDFDLCAKMTVRQLHKDAPPENVEDICKRVIHLSDFCSPETCTELAHAIGEQMDRFGEHGETIVAMGKAIFGLETECELAAYPDYFPLFMKVLRHGLVCDKEYIENVWTKQYIWVVQNTNGEEYLFPEEFIGDPLQESFSDAMYLLEIARLNAGVGYISTWDVIEAVVGGLYADYPEKAYLNIQSILDSNTPEAKTELLSEVVGTVRMYGLFLALFSPTDGKADYLLDFIMQDVNAFDMLILAAESEGFVGKLPQAYVYVWTCVYSAFADTMLESCWLGILDTESKVIEKPYYAEIMSTFSDYFKIVFDDAAKIPEIREDYIALMFRGICDYGWEKSLGLNEQQSDLIEMCYMIDNGTPEDSINYFYEALNNFIVTGRTGEGRAENIFLCAKRINRYLNNHRRKITDDNAAISKERITLMALARMYGQHHDESNCLFYLKGICEGDDHWIASLYVMHALKYLYALEPDEECYYIKDFLDTLRKIIISSTAAGRNTLISPESQAIYHGYIQPHLYEDQQKPLFTAARGTGNQDLVAMFTVKATKERPRAGFFGRRKK